MIIQTYIILALMFLAVLTSIGVGFNLILHFRTKVARWVGLLLLSQVLELACYLLQWINFEARIVQVIFLIQVFAYALFCIFWILFVFEFTLHSHWIRPRNIALLSTLPTLFFFMMVARWIQGSVVASESSAIVGSMVFSPLALGFPGTLFVIFSYGIDFFSVFVLLHFFSKSNQFIRKSLLPLLSGPILLALLGGMEVLNLNLIQPVSFHQFAIAGVSLLAFWVVFDLRMRNVLSSARETVVDQMQDGVLILDQQDKIVDLNPAFQNIIGSNSRNAVNQNLSQIWPQGAAMIAGQSGTQLSLGDTTIQVNGIESIYDINVSQLMDPYSESIGRVMVLRNVTGREQMEKTLNEQSGDLQRANAFLSALAQVNVTIQSATQSSQIHTTLGAELNKLGLACFIAQFDPVANELSISYMSSQSEVLRRIEKLFKLNVIGFRLGREQFPNLYAIFDSKKITFRPFRSDDLADSLGKVPVIIMEQAIRLIGFEPGVGAVVLPLVAGEHTLGMLGVWGPTLRESDISSFSIFANQVAHVMERVLLYEKEIQRSAELARVNNLVMALSKVASVLGTTINSELVLDTLGKELKNSGLNCAVITLDAAGQTAFIKYLSFSSELIQKIEQITGLQTKNLAIPRRLWPGDRIITQKAPIWYPNPGEYFRKLFPGIPKSASRHGIKLLNFEEDDQMCILPLHDGTHAIGGLVIWGPKLKPSDSPILKIFSSQVAGILRQLTNYESEVQRTDELVRSNAMIIALSKVAAQLDTTTNLTQVYTTLGNELKKIHVHCMVGTLDNTQQNMKIDYLSIVDDPSIWVEKFEKFWPKEVSIPRRLWPTDKALTERSPYWDPDPIGSISRMFPLIPRQIFEKTFELGGMTMDDRVCYLPMISEEDVIGILAVWGPALNHEDVPGLSVFANQVAYAIRNTRLYDQAQNEIHERTQAEARIREALQEKEVLLKEVHHRVKNNLQVISSLLNLQSAQTKDPVTVDILRESQNRVRSMALIHEKLYQSDDLARVDFVGYLHNLVTSLAQTYRINSEKVKILVNSEKISLNIDTAIPCGLIINELVSNSLKYAFPTGSSGTIEVSCRKSQDGCYHLKVSDNGTGLPDGFDVAGSPSLGLKLVTSLVRQLGGELAVDGKQGTSFQIDFRES